MINAYSFSHCGNHREENQDRTSLGEGVFCLADGMGGLSGGAAAADLAVARCVTLLASTKEEDSNSPDELRRVLEVVNQEIRLSLPGSGTTLSSLILLKNSVCALNIGDSRIYMLREGRATLLTMDQNLAATTGYAFHKNRLVNYLGKSTLDSPSVRFAPRLPGSIFVLCSDGLFDSVNIEDLAKTHITQNAKHFAADLEKLAVAADPADNYSAIIVEE
jgi:PPM family protein phosphatase